MVFPFATVFAHEFKGADEIVLGAMVTGAALTSVLFGIPLGRLADKVGRKRVLFLIGAALLGLDPGPALGAAPVW